LGEVAPVSGGLASVIGLAASYEQQSDGSYWQDRVYTRGDNPTYEYAERLLGAPPAVPQGFAGFGADETVRKLVPAPDSAHWTEFQRGWHFPALEAPAQLAADLRAFFGPLQ
jgi:hypothetical protein